MGHATGSETMVHEITVEMSSSTLRAQQSGGSDFVVAIEDFDYACFCLQNIDIVLLIG